MKLCAKCGVPFRGTSGKARYCSLECSGSPSLNKRHGYSGTKIHATWLDMRYRCRNPKHYNYARYGGRGIQVCERWDIFENFLEDMGEHPGKGYTIERIDNDGNYEPGNCKWGTKLEQSRNRCCNWTAEENEKLAQLLEDGLRYEDAALVLGKTRGAVLHHARRIKLKSRRGAGGILLPTLAISPQELQEG